MMRVPEKTMTQKISQRLRRTLCSVALVGAVFMSWSGSPNHFIKEAQAQCWGCGGCVAGNHDRIQALVYDESIRLRGNIYNSLETFARMSIEGIFSKHILPMLMMSTEQLTSVGMKQMEAIGGFMDAKHQNETLMLFQTILAESHRDFTTSTEMCTIASTTRSLSANARRSELFSHTLMQHSLDRQLGVITSMSSEGTVSDIKSRLEQFKTRFCNPTASNHAFGQICTAPDIANIDKDVNYTRLVEIPMTLKADFTTGNELEDDEADIFAFTRYIFGHNVFPRFTGKEATILSNQDEVMDMRAIVAKRSVAETGLYSIIGMKTQGGEESEYSAGYAGAILTQLGVPDDDVFHLLGERPSYFALMDLLSQKIYQDPNFIINLYDKPANVARKDVAIRAVNLMVERDIYKSDLRYEAMLAVMLETELEKHQARIQDRISGYNLTGAEGE
jgi:hypothetical protein